LNALGHPSHNPAAHYERVHDAWRLIMGEEFHYGYFEAPDVPLEHATAALTARMLTGARITRGDRVLDVGCGTGRQACDIAADCGASVLGITTSAAGVADACRLAARRGLDRVRFELRDGTANGLPDASFDVVWVLESSHLMADRQALLSECARVLAPGGRLSVCDIVRKREIPFAEVRARRDEFALLRAAFGDARMDPLDSYAQTVRGLGLELVDCSDVSEQTLPTFSAWRANVAANEPRLRELIGAAAVEEFVRATILLESLWADGTLGYGMLAARRARVSP
jgi:27-O-demethylrifamycin SV methyltransferase